MLITDLLCHWYNYTGSPGGTGKRERGYAFSKKERTRKMTGGIGQGKERKESNNNSEIIM